MTSPTGRNVGPFAIAVAVAAAWAAVSVAVALLYSPPSATESEYSYPVDVVWFQALSAVALVFIGIWLRSRQEAAAYACLAAACVLSGWAAQAIWQSSIAARDPLFAVGFLFRLSSISATAGVLAAFASTPARRLDRRTPVALALLVGVTAAAAGFETLIEARGWTGEYFAIEQVAFVDLLVSPLPLLVILALGAWGSVRNEALRYRPGAAADAPAQPNSGSTALRWAVGLACIAALAVAAAGQMNPPEEGLRWTLLPLLAGLVAAVAGRWSNLIAWSAVAISFSATAAAVAVAALDAVISEYVSRYEADPATQWAPGPVYWIEVAGVALVGVVAIAAASRALSAARRAKSGQSGRATVPPRVLVGIAVVVVGWGTLATYFSSSNAVWVLPVSAMFTAALVLTGLLLITVAEAARARLVPAVAEAEAVASRPFLPLRYLEMLASEALTGRSSLRRTATAAERSRLASDLHAGLLPSLAAITAQSEAGAPSADLVVRLRRLEDEVRDLMAERRLVILEEFGLVEAIEWLLGRAEERQSLEVNLSVDDRTTAERPPREVERAAFRIAQLAVENALQHAAPKRLVLEVLARADAVRLSVADDGRGLATATGDPGRDRFGIADMRSQAAEVRGDVQVVAPPAGGTSVTFAWPAI